MVRVSIVRALLVIAALSLLYDEVCAANILGIFTSKSASHLIVHMSVAKVLAERGHNVTVVTSIDPKVNHKNIRTIVIPPSDEHVRELEEQMAVMANQKNSIYTVFSIFLGSKTPMVDLQFDLLKDERFTALYDEKFDLMIWGFFLNDFQLGVAAKFKCPVIIDWSGAPNGMILSYVGNPFGLSYVPHVMLGVNVGESMTFIQRLQNLFTNCFMNMMVVFINRKVEAQYNQLFPTENFPSLQEMRENVSLLFANSHFSEGPIQAFVPALVEIGGIQIKDKPDPLPKDIAEFLDASKQHGAILFSLGSNVQSSSVNPETLSYVFKVLSGLKQNVIWKWEDPNKTPGNAKNILYKQWMPQDDILAHPNLKLFITHAGKGGIAESLYHGVPMVALPVFGDQQGNAEKMFASGYGKMLDMIALNAADFKEVITEVLENPVYEKNAKEFSKLYRDRPLTAKENVVFWTEYVLRHRGAPHMQSPLKYMKWYENSNLDVFTFLLIAIYLTWRILKLIVKGCYAIIKRIIKGRGSKKVKTK